MFLMTYITQGLLESEPKLIQIFQKDLGWRNNNGTEENRVRTDWESIKNRNSGH